MFCHLGGFGLLEPEALCWSHPATEKFCLFQTKPKIIKGRSSLWDKHLALAAGRDQMQVLQLLWSFGEYYCAAPKINAASFCKVTALASYWHKSTLAWQNLLEWGFLHKPHRQN